RRILLGVLRGLAVLRETACCPPLQICVHRPQDHSKPDGRCPHKAMKRGKTASRRKRATYRHGDLHRALLQAGIELARTGGPDAVVLREATRRAGVVPNAAYRHFAGRSALLQAVRAASLSALAVAMETELASLDPDLSPADQARASLRAIG